MLLSNLFLLAVDVPTLDHSLSDVAGKDNFAPGDYTDIVHFYQQLRHMAFSLWNFCQPYDQAILCNSFWLG